ncbi:radical SAM protein [Nannocystis punicea]|uniref:Radical SAM protein n=1 Tax=Nannocystis punicea TaxID=2995304 RepID=A0ABY7GSC8_9BACT|nr:radical SAM protein [Nannocystis poenicansa]WAS89836.1 radical SAM protein [Nannocystis poenicansa]
MRPGRVLVVHPPVSVARDFIDYPYFIDLGAVQLAAVLEARGIACDLVDAYALPARREAAVDDAGGEVAGEVLHAASAMHWRSDGRAHLGATVAATLAACPQSAAAIVVAITPFHRPPARDDLLGELLAGLRARLGADVPIVLADCYQSGQHYVAAPQLLASYPEADAYVQFEAEVTVPALLAGYLDGGPAPRGLHRGDQPVLEDLPVPAWSKVDLEAYHEFRAAVVRGLGRGGWAFPIDGRTLPVVTSRGCPFQCAHCSSNPDVAPGRPKTQRRHSRAALSRLLTALAREHGAGRVFVLDELINVHPDHFDHVLEDIRALDLRFELPNGLRADYLEPRHLQAMRGRLTTLSVSAESGVQRVVDEVVGKRLELAAIVRAAESAAAAGVPLMIHYIIGQPGETAAEINQTLSFALDLWDRFKAWPAVQFATPLPGTRLARSLPLAPPPEDHDWGPRFQRAPTGATVPAALLEKFRWTFEQRLRASQGPRKLVMNATYACNNHCSFCAVGTRTQLHGDAERLREQLAHYRKQGVELLDIDGGEPTLHPDLLGLIRHARALGYRAINVTTNGRLCAYEAFAARLVNSGLSSLLFSVHGADARTHAQNVGVAEAFEQTLAGVRNAVRLAPRGVELGLNLTITKHNEGQLEAITALAWSLGLRWVNYQFLTPFGRATAMLAPDTARAAATLQTVIEAWQGRMKLQVINLPFCFMPGHEALMQGDLGKLERHMAFVNNETVNLAQYLAERRVRKPVCASCPHACFCGGFYELDEAPEPPWLIAPEDLVRPLADPRRHESVPVELRERLRKRAESS